MDSSLKGGSIHPSTLGGPWGALGGGGGAPVGGPAYFPRLLPCVVSAIRYASDSLISSHLGVPRLTHILHFPPDFNIYSLL